MEPITFTVVFLDGTEKTVIAVAADLVAFEEKFDKSVSALTNDPRITHLFFICWHVLKRTGESKIEFEKWMETVSGVVVGDDEKK
jgi:hypothetical protein